MATIEIHDSRGSVQRLELTPDQVIWFGSDPGCDVKLLGPGVAPYHFRVRSKAGRYRVEVAPEAPEVEVNGRKTRKEKLDRGDEIAYAGTRVFLVQVDTAPVLALDDDPGFADAPPASPSPSASPVVARTASAPAQPQATPTQPTPPTNRRPKNRDEESEEDGWGSLGGLSAQEAVPVARAKAATSLSPLGRLKLGEERPPGQERLLTSPLAIGLAATLALLGAVGYGLKVLNDKNTRDNLFLQAEEAYKTNDFAAAIDFYDQFLAFAPEDERVGRARVQRGMATVQKLTSSGSASWLEALETIQTVHPQIKAIPEFEDARILLAELTLRTASALAERTTRSGKAEDLAVVERAVELHREIAREATAQQIDRLRFQPKLEEAKAAVEKAGIKAQRLAAIERALKDGDPVAAYSQRDDLVRRYPDLASDKAIMALLVEANDLLKTRTKLDTRRVPAQTEEQAHPLNPPLSLVLRDNAKDTKSDTTNPGRVVFAVAEGIAYGLDDATGQPLWQRVVGRDTPFPPVALPGSPASAILFETQSNQLVRVHARDGALIWRQPLGAEIAAPPLVAGNTLIQPTRSGDLVRLSLANGHIVGRLTLGRPLDVTPATDETGRYLYAPANQANLFIVDLDGFTCAEVLYLGHGPGALKTAPVRAGPYLILPENHREDRGRWRVLRIESDGARLTEIQTVDLGGWTWYPPAWSGAVIWSTDDKGGVTAFALGAADQPNPIRKIAELPPEQRAPGAALAVTRSEKEVFVAASRSGQFTVAAELGRLERGWTLETATPPAAPVQLGGGLTDPIVVFTLESTVGTGVDVLGVSSKTGKPLWKTILGAAWPTPLRAGPDGRPSTVDPSGRIIPFEATDLVQGGFRIQPPPPPRPPGSNPENDDPTQPLWSVEPRGTVWIGRRRGDDRRYALLTDQGPAQFLTPPAAPTQPPLPWHDGELVPAAEGRVFFHPANSDEFRACTLVERYDKAQPVVWTRPVPLPGPGEAVLFAEQAGLLRRVVAGEDGLPVVEVAVNLNRPLAGDCAAIGQVVLAITNDQTLHVRNAADLEPIAKTPLEAPLAVGPAAITPDLAIVADAAGNLLAYGGDGQRLWTTKLRSEPPVGPPVRLGGDTAESSGLLVVLGRDGVLQRLDPVNGAVVDRTELQLRPAGNLVPSSDPAGLVIPIAPGSLRLLPQP